MLPSKIESLVRRYTGASSSQYTQTDFYDDLNMVKDEFWNKIVAQKSWRQSRWDISKANTTVVGQSEYKFPTIANIPSIKTISSVAINYDWKTMKSGELVYTPAIEVNPYTLPYDWQYYKQEQSQDKPIYYVADKSVFIAPMPTEARLNGLKIEWVFKIPDYTTETTEAQMIIEPDFHQTLLLGVIPYALMSKRAPMDEINKAQVDYERKMIESLRIITDMTEEPKEMRYPWFTNHYDELWIER